MPARHLFDLTWPEVAEVASSTLLAVPLGATEQHGPHLPIGTDMTIATALVDRFSEARLDVIAAPALHSGFSRTHAGLAGTLSIGHPPPTILLRDLGPSVEAFTRVLLGR